MATLNSPAAKKTLTALVGAVVAMGCLTFTGQHEGVSLTPYRDKAGHGQPWTVCYGDTQVAMHAYTLAQCQDMLATRLAEYAAPVIAITPGFTELTAGQQITAIDFAYNLGNAWYAKSTLRQMYIRRDFPAACDQYPEFFKSAGKDCRKASSNCYGLYQRRLDMRALCRGEP